MSEHIDKQRTGQQNRALHLYLTMVAHELQNQGQTLQDVVKKINKVEIMPTKDNLKEVVWREIQKVMTGKESTTFLDKHEVTEIYDVMNKWLGQHFEIHIPWPDDGDDVAPLKDKIYN